MDAAIGPLRPGDLQRHLYGRRGPLRPGGLSRASRWTAGTRCCRPAIARGSGRWRWMTCTSSRRSRCTTRAASRYSWRASTTDDVVAALAAGYFVADVANYGVTPGYPVLTSSDVSVACTGATRFEAWGKFGRARHAHRQQLHLHLRRLRAVRPAGGLRRLHRAVRQPSPTAGRPTTGHGTRTARCMSRSTDTARAMILRRHRQGDFSAQVDMKMSSGGRDRGQLMFNVLDARATTTHPHRRRRPSAASTTSSPSDRAPGSAGAVGLDRLHANRRHLVHRQDGLRRGHRHHPRQGVGYRRREPDWMLTAVDTTWTFGALRPPRQPAPASSTTSTPTASRRSTSRCSSTLPSGTDNRSDSTLGLRAGGLSLLVRKSGVQGIDRRLESRRINACMGSRDRSSS